MEFKRAVNQSYGERPQLFTRQRSVIETPSRGESAQLTSGYLENVGLFEWEQDLLNKSIGKTISRWEGLKDEPAGFRIIFTDGTMIDVGASENIFVDSPAAEPRGD